MKQIFPKRLNGLTWLSLLFFTMVLLVTACKTEGEADNALPDIQGPALVMFYTDG
ncbi:MAG: hypothetical protein KDE09_04010 [Anaerolineales bacterium]|nr:hypothetical protein [Anaerolineales bacterium]MCB0016929.1 hypothetical protein [Anaerolineales bacterium]MCB0027078.1 hypothetical protein [Anaerolineales bacterium]